MADNQEVTMEPRHSTNCLCGTSDLTDNMLMCKVCNRFFHAGCLKMGRPSTLEGDIYFHLVCGNCSVDGKEVCTRMKLQWFPVVMLALYNLHLSGTGKFGYFRWKDHICGFIDRNWGILFGDLRQKTSLWHGTVAGILSSGAPMYFLSGSAELEEPGWWKLTNLKLPTLRQIETMGKSGKKRAGHVACQEMVVGGLRSRRGKRPVQAVAMELKAKRSTLLEAKEIRKTKLEVASSLPSSSILASSLGECRNSGQVNIGEALSANEERAAARISKDPLTGEQKPSENAVPSHSEKFIPQLLGLEKTADESDSDLEIDIGTGSPLPLSDEQTSPERRCLSPTVEEIIASIGEKSIGIQSSWGQAGTPVSDSSSCSSLKINEKVVDLMPNVKQEGDAIKDEEEEMEDSEIEECTDKKVQVNVEEPDKQQRFTPISLYHERQLLKSLHQLATKCNLGPDLCRLRRKFIIRQLKRERGLPLFDLDVEVNHQLANETGGGLQNKKNVPIAHCHPAEIRVLDRFQSHLCGIRHQPSRRQPLFINRLVGIEDDQLQNICSPYTTRMLKPFIFRDYEIRPLKMQLLEEIKAYPHRNVPEWEAPLPPAPIDYCYVRPQHIPSVNILCQQFFWPGIDLSECLQYPDFSCIVLYRKIVIAFAFMVPDVKYNEAYISFIFTHPEWRRAGIATFMLYHLIQTCMGKDLTLHVSANNTAMLLYQKFGFKPEDFILDFYDKYYPGDSQECKHAFFLRLRR